MMAKDDLAAGAHAGSVVLRVGDLPDPRQRGKLKYPPEILLLCLVAVLAGADCIAEIARFGEKKRDLLRRFRPFADGTPSHDHLGDMLASLDANAFQHCVAWTASLTGVDPDVTAIDGKTSRRSDRTKGGSDPIHMVSAFAACQRLVLGQVKVAGTSNKIIAISEPPGDDGHRGCHRDHRCHGMSARDRAGHRQQGRLHPGAQGNQGTLRNDVDLFVAEQKAKGFKDTIVSRDTVVEGDHGRIETRTTTVIHKVDWLDHHRWPGLKSIVVVDAQRDIGGKGAVDAAWSYEAPYAAVAGIRDHLAFYPDRVDAIEERDA